ncbi:hypothetical protein MMC25_003629 [Agyrium rufum]|nr:hypothetical protein [Agyrium rufum]
MSTTEGIPSAAPNNNGPNPRGGRNSNGPRGNRDGRGARGNRRGGRGGPRSDPAISIPHVPNGSLKPAPSLPPPPGLGGGGSFSGRLTEDAKTGEGEGVAGVTSSTEEAVEDGLEAEVCFICASPVVHNSVASCNHRTCHICALRLRALYKTRACAHCRTEAKFVIFTDDAVKRYQDFHDEDFEQVDDILGIKYEKKEIFDDTVLLLRYNCPEPSCDMACWGWPDLHRHVKSTHQKALCDLCTRNKKVFTHEHELFTISELRKHERTGDDHPGAIDQSGFKGHPECGFCRQRFYGDDELFTHCRDKHEKCHICDRRNQGRQQQYYVDYNSLELHFRKDHFLCAEQDCLDKKFVVFESEMDLKAHQLESHPGGLSKDARKDARRVDISAFDYRTPHQEPRGGRRDRDRGGRGWRDPNAEPLPQSSAQPLRRDELAYQRQMAIQSAQSVSTRTFGGQLTAPTPAYAARAPTASQPLQTVTAPRQGAVSNPSYPPVQNLSLDNSASTTPQDAAMSPISDAAVTPQEQARRIHHAAVMSRATAMLKSDTSKTSDFRAQVSAYRMGHITANQLIDTFFTLFDVPTPDLGKLIKELAEIYENESKRNDLLKAWNDWRAVNEDYPSLPGPGGVLSGSSSATTGSTGGRRILKLKSSTAQSSRSATNRHESWGSAAANNTGFPGLPPSSDVAASANRAGAGKVGPVPWAGASSSSTPRSTVTSTASRTAPSSGASRGGPTINGGDGFPALPMAVKPNTTIFGLHRGTVNWDDGRSNRPVGNPWGGSSGTPVSTSANGSGASTPKGRQDAGADEALDGLAVGGKKKVGKGKKQTLYKFG